uniref:Integrase catalytic subunit n=1 Tax=Aeromonas hydrophila TaxID=644 RepID=A0A068CMD4_AERHY|nr:integrase catalytic subunit [Aeromonas hydrophila]AID21757.1 integrase catalytic subunit [Aeromonas hydrophila]
MSHPNGDFEPLILLLARRQWALMPVIEARERDLQHTTDIGNGIEVLLVGYPRVLGSDS